MSDLKPCPFCGGKVSVTYSSWNKAFNIWHDDKPCALIEPMQIDGTKANSLKEAIDLWNRRANITISQSRESMLRGRASNYE